MKDQEEVLKPGIYMVATPIGNLEDLSPRALKVLKAVDWIAAEDTRETKKLLDRYGIEAELVSYHEHSSHERLNSLMGRLRSGESGAYVSDAGAPGISDPGAKIVEKAHQEGLSVIPIPGASAPITLLCASGFDASSFTFHGFFPREKKDREEWLDGSLAVGGLHVFFESPHRVVGALEFLAGRVPDSEIVMGRELTKFYETIVRDSVLNVLELLQKKEPKGEFVFVLSLEKKVDDSHGKAMQLMKDLAAAGAPHKALLRAGIVLGMPKNMAYEFALQLKKTMETP